MQQASTPYIGASSCKTFKHQILQNLGQKNTKITKLPKGNRIGLLTNTIIPEFDIFYT
jgi:hypothetical protein